MSPLPDFKDLATGPGLPVHQSPRTRPLIDENAVAAMDPDSETVGMSQALRLARGVSAWHDSEVCKWHRDSAKTTREQDAEAQASRRRAADRAGNFRPARSRSSN